MDPLRTCIQARLSLLWPIKMQTLWPDCRAPDLNYCTFIYRVLSDSLNDTIKSEPDLTIPLTILRPRF